MFRSGCFISTRSLFWFAVETSILTLTFELNKVLWIRGTDLRITTDVAYLYCLSAGSGTH